MLRSGSFFFALQRLFIGMGREQVSVIGVGKGYEQCIENML